MKINYKETTTDLLARIDIHNQFGSRNIDDWMLDQIPLKKGMKILDVACGAGKQCFSFYHQLEGDCGIMGVDVSQDLLEKAKHESEEKDFDITFGILDFNKAFDIEDDEYDLLSCCFAIYYAENIAFTIKEMHRVLKPGGKLFTTGPMPQNKKVFYEIISEATQKNIPPMPGSSRYDSEILDTIKSHFSKVDNSIFENPLIFNTAEPFLQYTRASLSEDRKLWTDFFNDKDDFEKIMNQISVVANKYIENNGNIVMTKVVGGFLATK